MKSRGARGRDGDADRAYHWMSRVCVYGAGPDGAGRHAPGRAETNSDGAARDNASPDGEPVVSPRIERADVAPALYFGLEVLDAVTNAPDPIPPKSFDFS